MVTEKQSDGIETQAIANVRLNLYFKWNSQQELI